MERAAEFSVTAFTEGCDVSLTGDWTGDRMDFVSADLHHLIDGRTVRILELSAVSRLDTAGAYALVKAIGAALPGAEARGRPETLRLVELVAQASAGRLRTLPKLPRGFHELAIRLGRSTVQIANEIFETLVFSGHLIAVVGRSIVNPRRIRWAACFSLAERAGLDAIPIVSVTSFFIGAVVGLLGANMLQQFGAEVFVVELIAIAVVREFSVIITAILLAGRSASAFAAEIGSMKMNQEIDAMRVMGVDPFEALVFPRFAALLVTTPLLTFVAILAGLAGGLMVTWIVLDIGPAFFLQRMIENVKPVHLFVGMSKTPIMATIIAGIGCRQGLEVGGDVESLGRRVTAAVVHAIFSIIMIDAGFALIYMEFNL